jgi:hypothetical protein
VVLWEQRPAAKLVEKGFDRPARMVCSEVIHQEPGKNQYAGNAQAKSQNIFHLFLSSLRMRE